MANEHKTVMVSSTARDLPEHRKQVMDACLRQGMFPIMMEHLPPSESDAIRASMEMVDRADIYVLVLAHRYGTILEGQNASVTELEYNRAVQRGIPRLCFVIDKAHPLRDFTIADIDTGENAIRLEAFKERVGKENIVGFFTSPEDLRGDVIHGLSQHREADVTQFHYVSNIPEPPEPYVAHPYTLLQTRRLVGRQTELNLLTDWVTKKQEDIYATRIMNIVAIGGMGKSALTWKWFNEIAPKEVKPLAGRMWWSFYESDATFENFVVRTLAYISGRSIEEVKQIPSSEGEQQLFQILDREPYLLVLDGLERILIAYARMDAARLSDDDLDQKAANYVAKAYGLPESAGQSFVGQHQLRKTTDPRAGSFLRKLANVRSARILVSTRLYPADLQSITGEPIGGCSAIFLPGLSDDDALELWREFNVTGSRESLLPLFHKFENHALLLQALASEIANYRRAPGDFERWQKDHPEFDPFSLPLTQVKGHVLSFAMRGLYENARKVLETIAAFRMPAQYDTLVAIFTGTDKRFSSELELDQALKELEDRGLLGWDKRANRYDLHPIVRGVVWSGLPQDMRADVLTSLQGHFNSLPTDDQAAIKNLEDITPSIELFNTLIGLAQYREAVSLYIDRLLTPMLSLNFSRQSVELLEMVEPHLLEIEGDSQITDEELELGQSLVLLLLALGYQQSGQPTQALNLFKKHLPLMTNYALGISGDADALIALSFLSQSHAELLLNCGRLYEAEFSTRDKLANQKYQAKDDARIIQLEILAITLATRGVINQATMILIDLEKGYSLFAPSYLINIALMIGKYDYVIKAADTIREKLGATYVKLEIRAKNMKGIAELELGRFVESSESLNDALLASRKTGLIEEEICALIWLAELQRRQKDPKSSRDLLNNVWELAERGNFSLLHTDALNILARIESDENNKDSAIKAATMAYRLAWCDGPPYAYHWGLEKAKQYLKELGAAEPEMPPFDESKFEPMPEVDINPKDEFRVDPDKGFNIDDLLKDE